MEQDQQQGNAVAEIQVGGAVPGGQLHLRFLDGLRGLAALYVVLYHAYLRAHTGLPPALNWLIAPFGYGRIAVDVFIVLSGYCLMLPVARSREGRLRGGIARYLKRRARRILPPYYVAYLLSLGLVLLSEIPRYLLHRANSFVAAVAPGNTVSHLLMLFNLSDDYRFSINGAFWSVATEWQIYFLFPLLLLPVWRRFGAGAAAIAGIAAGMAPHYLLPPGHNFDGASLYYLGLFALGMAGAAIGFAPGDRSSAATSRVPWGRLASALMIPFVIVTALVKPLDPWSPALMRHYTPWSDVWVGVITMCLIVSCAHARRSPASRPSPVLRLLESPAAVTLGAFSYSIYLTHLAIMDKIEQVALHFRLNPLLTFVWQWIVGTGLALAFAYLFYLGVERRFLNVPVPLQASSRTKE